MVCHSLTIRVSPCAPGFGSGTYEEPVSSGWSVGVELGAAEGASDAGAEAAADAAPDGALDDDWVPPQAVANMTATSDSPNRRFCINCPPKRRVDTR